MLISDSKGLYFWCGYDDIWVSTSLFNLSFDVSERTTNRESSWKDSLWTNDDFFLSVLILSTVWQSSGSPNNYY